MKRFAEVLPAAGLVLLFIVLVSLELVGFHSVGRWTQTTVGAMSLIFGLLILGLCITGMCNKKLGTKRGRTFFFHPDFVGEKVTSLRRLNTDK